MAYEFDAADTLDSYLYPAIAKMLRGESVEFAAQFQYDPLALADENRNWHTHYMNLVFTPKLAVSCPAVGGVERHSHSCGFRHLLWRLAMGAETCAQYKTRRPPPCMHEIGVWHSSLS